MNERDFVSKKRADWDRLAGLIERANRRRGLRALSREDVLEIGPLYRRVSSDLAYARARAVSEDLVAHLNSLVGRAHALLYETESSGSAARSALNFYVTDFPTLLQRHFRLFLVTMSIALAGGLLSYWLVIHQPERLSLFVPPGFESSVEAWKSGKMKQEPLVEGASWYMTHNYQVGMITFASGFLLGIPTASMLFDTGTMMGALAALMAQVHQMHNFWPGVLPHGIAELTAIFICGTAGFLIALSLLLPGERTRADALKIAGLNAIKLVLGSIPLFVFAGVIEAMFSRLDGVSANVRYAFSAVNGVLWYLYLFLPRRGTQNAPTTSLTRNLQTVQSVEA